MVDRLSSPIVLDASVLINLVATEITEQLLASFGVQVYAAQVAFDEVTRDPRKRGPIATTTDPLVERGALVVVPLDDAELETFLNFVGAEKPDDLGDGEAATIAVAASRGFAVALDDGKAIRILRAQHPMMRQLYTVDLFALAEQSGLVSRDDVRRAREDAIKYARMRIPNR